MSVPESSRTRIYPVSEEERQLIRNELAEVLKTPHFANSKRYPAFLLHTVEKTIEGHSADLKERTLGVEVFHRRPDYDTNADTVVRFAAGEVRKRLALVYHESDFQHTVQITLPTGSYVPEFFRVHPSEQPAAPEKAEEDPTGSGEQVLPGRTPSPPPARQAPARHPWLLASCGIALSLVAAGALVWFFHTHGAARQSSVDRFWQPLRSASTSPLISTGASVISPTNAGLAEAEKNDDYPYVSMVDATASVDLADLFARSKTDYSLKPTSATTLTDMREHPVILLGAYNNQWTLRLLNDAPFRFAPKPATQIYDGANPARKWQRPPGLPYKDADDYAVVARFHSKLTDNTVVVIAGIGKNGTEAAAQFVLTPRYLDQLDSRSKDWASRNVEAVLKTSVVDGKTGAPSIEAVSVW